MEDSNESGGIIRTVRDRNHPYKVVNTRFADDKRLSFEARGLMAYLLAKPDDWQVRFNDLIKQSPDAKRQKLRGILKELELHGYLVREKVRKAHGRFDWVSTVYETPELMIATIGQFSTPGESGDDGISDGSAPGVDLPPVDEPPVAAPPADAPPVVNRPIYIVSTSTKYGIKGEGAAPAPATAPAADIPPGKRPTSDPNQTHPACLLYLEITGYRPARASAAKIAATIPRDAASLDRWRIAVDEWVTSGNRYTNVKGMLDWYRDGVPPARPAGRAASAPARPAPVYETVRAADAPKKPVADAATRARILGKDRV